VSGLFGRLQFHFALRINRFVFSLFVMFGNVLLASFYYHGGGGLFTSFSIGHRLVLGCLSRAPVSERVWAFGMKCL
jgi:hypothetical protein